MLKYCFQLRVGNRVGKTENKTLKSHSQPFKDLVCDSFKLDFAENLINNSILARHLQINMAGVLHFSVSVKSSFDFSVSRNDVIFQAISARNPSFDRGAALRPIVHFK